jgi:hypothetical protein
MLLPRRSLLSHTLGPAAQYRGLFLSRPEATRPFDNSCNLVQAAKGIGTKVRVDEKPTLSKFIDWPTDASGMRRQLSPAADIASDRVW